MQLCHRRAAPIPIAVVDLEDLESGFENERVRDHRVVRLVGELLDVQILLDAQSGSEERPSGAQRVSELIDVQLIVGRDEDQPGVRGSELGIDVDQLPNELMLLGSKPPRERWSTIGLPLAAPTETAACRTDR